MGFLISEATDSQFWNAGVYDSSAISLNRNRIPGSRVRNDKNNARKGKGACLGRPKGGKLGRIDGNPGESGNHYSEVEFGNEGGGDYPDNWGSD